MKKSHFHGSKHTNAERKKSNEDDKKTKTKLHVEKVGEKNGGPMFATAGIGIFSTEIEITKIRRDYHISCMKSVRRLWRFKSFFFGRAERKIEREKPSGNKT